MSVIVNDTQYLGVWRHRNLENNSKSAMVLGTYYGMGHYDAPWYCHPIFCDCKTYQLLGVSFKGYVYAMVEF